MSRSVPVLFAGENYRQIYPGELVLIDRARARMRQYRCRYAALLHPGLKDITLGPRLPAFVSPGVLNVLTENFGIKKNSTVEADLARMVPAA